MNDEHNISSHEAKVKSEGRYANVFKAGYRECVFVVDFGQSNDENDERQFNTRIIMSPNDIKQLLHLLMQSIEQYEKDYGPIQNEEA